MASIPKQEPIRIAIVGGGIGGLALSIGLQKYSHVEVKIYEAASKFWEIGGELMILLNSVAKFASQHPTAG